MDNLCLRERTRNRQLAADAPCNSYHALVPGADARPAVRRKQCRRDRFPRASKL